MNAFAFDSLESRRMFSAAVSVTLSNGNLTVTGTEAADQVILSNAGNGNSDLLLRTTGSDGKLVSRVVKDLKSIKIDVKGGNDAVNIDFTARVSVPVSIIGGTGDDSLSDASNNRNATIDGGDGNDTMNGKGTLIGGRGNDSLSGPVARDDGISYGQVIDGGDGDDVLEGAGGSDTLIGGAGNDTIYELNRANSDGSAAVVVIDAGSGNDIVDASGTDPFAPSLTASWSINTGSGDDTVTLSTSAVVNLGAGRDRFVLQNVRNVQQLKSVTVYGGDDADTFVADAQYGRQFGTDRVTLDIHGGAGNDTVDYRDFSNLAASFSGDDGNDTINGSDSADTIHGGAGDDVIDGYYGSDVIFGDAGNDTLTGKWIAQTFHGGDGNDTISGSDKNDAIYGDAGSDVLFGRAGNDVVNGGEGNDIIDGGIGNDTLHGDSGNDSLFGSDGNDVLDGGAGRNRLHGQNGTDVIHSKNNATDTLYATKGDNILDRDSFDVLA